MAKAFRSAHRDHARHVLRHSLGGGKRLPSECTPPSVNDIILTDLTWAETRDIRRRKKDEPT